MMLMHARPRDLAIGTAVCAKNIGQGPPWLSGIIKESNGSVSYIVKDVRILWRHVDHVRVHTA